MYFSSPPLWCFKFYDPTASLFTFLYIFIKSCLIMSSIALSISLLFSSSVSISDVLAILPK
nr:MAG TPA: hypothetical protein [Bacteriophage sp.]